jgi:hypothetical protein
MIRDQIIQALEASVPTGFSVSSQFPWTAQGEPLYLKNRKVVYVSDPDTQTTPLFTVLGQGHDVMQQSSRLNVFFSVDARNVPSSTQQLVQDINGVKNLFSDSFRREVELTLEFVDSTKIYQFEINLVTIPNQGAQQ